MIRLVFGFLLLFPTRLVAGDFRIQRGLVYHAAMSQNGRVLSVFREGAFEWIDGETGLTLDRWAVKEATGSHTLSADGGRLAFCAGDWVLMASRTEKRVVKRLRIDANTLAISPDGRWLASLRFDTLRVTDLKTGRPVKGATRSNVDAYAWTPEGRLLVAGRSPYSEPASVRLLDIPTGRSLWQTALDEGERIRALAIITGRIAAGSENGSLRMIDAGSGQVRHRVQAHAGPVLALAFTTGGDLASLASRDRAMWGPELIPMGRMPAPELEDSLYAPPTIRFDGADLLEALPGKEGIWRVLRAPWPELLQKVSPSLPAPFRLGPGKPLAWMADGTALVAEPSSLVGYGPDLKERWRLQIEDPSPMETPWIVGAYAAFVRRLPEQTANSLHWFDPKAGRWLTSRSLQDADLIPTKRGLLLREGDSLALLTSPTEVAWRVSLPKGSNVGLAAPGAPWSLLQIRTERQVEVRWLDLRSGAWGTGQRTQSFLDRPLELPSDVEKQGDWLAALEGALVVRTPEGVRCMEPGGRVVWNLPLEPGHGARFFIRPGARLGVVALADDRWGWVDPDTGWIQGTFQHHSSLRPWCMGEQGDLVLQMGGMVGYWHRQAGPGAPLLSPDEQRSPSALPKGEVLGMRGGRIETEEVHWGEAPARGAALIREGEAPRRFLIGPQGRPVVAPASTHLLFERQGSVWVQPLESLRGPS